MTKLSFQPAQVFSEYEKIKTVIFNSIQLELEVLNNDRQLYNPSQFSLQIAKAYKNNNLVQLLNAIRLYSSHAFLFYFFPFWIVSFPFYLFKNLKIWRSTWLKISFSLSEYKSLTQTALMTNFKRVLNFQIVIIVFPCVFGISYIIHSRYQHQVFSYFLHKNLPGAYPCLPNLKWDTFQNITSQHLNTESLCLTKDLSKKTFNFNTDLNSQIKSGQANTSQSPITSAFKVNKFMKQIDFYPDSVLIKFNSNWLNKQNQRYIGFFPKQKFLANSLVSTNPFQTPSNSLSIGNNWHLISPNYFIPGSSTLNKNLSKNSPFLGNQRQFLSDTPSLSQTVVVQAKYKYWETFYLNLDELPKKLNSRTLHIFTSTVTNENAPQPIQLLPVKKQFHENTDFLINTIARKLKNQNQIPTGNVVTTELAFAVPGRAKGDQFNLEDQKNLESSLLKEVNVNATSIKTLADFKRNFEFFSKNTTYVSENIKFKFKKIENLFDLKLDAEKQVYLTKKSNLKKVGQLHNTVDGKVHLNSRPNSSIQILDGFSNTYPVRPVPLPAGQWEDKEVSLNSESFLLNKATLFQNELRQHFYNNDLKPLPHFVKFEFDDKHLPSFLIGNDFVIQDNRVFEHSKGDLNSAFYTFANSPLTAKSKLDSSTIKQEKPSIITQHKPTSLKNKVLLEHPTANQLETSSEFDEYCSEQILKILQDFEPVKRNSAVQPRTMSGYEFPDTVDRELRSLILQWFYQTTVSLTKNPLLTHKIQNNQKLFSPTFKVELPPSFTSYLKYNYSNPKPPQFKLTYTPTFLLGVKKILYEGPGVLREDLTQDLRLTNKNEVQQWIKQFFSPDNLLTDRRQIFFGTNLTKFVSATLDQEQNQQITGSQIASTFVKKEENTTSEVTLKKGFSQDLDLGEVPKIKKDLNLGRPVQTTFQSKEELIKAKFPLTWVTLPILPGNDEFQVPYIEEAQWRVFVEKLKVNLEKEKLRSNLEEELEDTSDSEAKFQINVPVIRIRNPKQENIHWPLNQLDYQSLNDFIFSSENNLVTKSTTWIVLPHFELTPPVVLSPSHARQGNRATAKAYHASISFGDITYGTANQENLTSINYHYLPSAQIALNETLAQKKVFGNDYKKVVTVYKNILENNYESFNGEQRKNLFSNLLVKKFRRIFYQSWEPITTGSWMMITQLSFGLVALQILQKFRSKYGKEILDALASTGIIDESLKEELQIDDSSQGFRIIRNVEKRFKDIVGIDTILPELGELVWFLRNSGRSFKTGNIMPKGILLVGSPGTGKTLLVQAIAGEAEVPVLAQSGSSLKDPDQNGGGADVLQDLFEEARRMAPCIVFIDELDALGEKRDNLIQNPMGEDEIIESIQQQTDFNNLSHEPFIPKPKIKFRKKQEQDREEQNLVSFSQQVEESQGTQSFTSQSSELEVGSILQQSIDKQKVNKTQVRTLLQFLIELDGLHAQKGVIVIGATNRPDALDLALIRPGRFDKTIQVGLPEKQKRIEILKFYSTTLGTENTIPWDYLANRTVGFSAADLASVMNKSALQAILGDTIHTIKTIEDGIESITNYSSETIELDTKNFVDPFFMSRLAYYQAGKAVVHTLLIHHPSVIVLHLWPRKKNARHAAIRLGLQNKFLKSSRKVELESQIVGLYAGKAAECLVLSNHLRSRPSSEIQKKTSTRWTFQANSGSLGSYAPTAPFTNQQNNLNILDIIDKPPYSGVNQDLVVSKHLWQSDIGIEDLSFATYLVELMITKWYFYSKNLVTRNANQIFSHRNSQEFKEVSTVDLFHELAIRPESEIRKRTRFSGFGRDSQKWGIRAWWQARVTDQTELVHPAFDDWYRLYLPDPTERERNQEWIPPDEYYHNNNNLSDLALKSTKSSINFNELYANDRDYILHGLLLTCFNKAFTILDKNREFLDYLASYLMRNEILREHEITDILLQFKPEGVLKITRDFSDLPKDSDLTQSGKQEKVVLDKNKEKLEKKKKSQEKKVKIIEKSWGKNSRRKIFHFFKY